jgi:hypothetical protein
MSFRVVHTVDEHLIYPFDNDHIVLIRPNLISTKEHNAQPDS